MFWCINQSDRCNYIRNLVEFEQDSEINFHDVRLVQSWRELACSCPRGWRVSASSIEASLKPLKHHSTMVEWGSRGALNSSPIMPRGESLSDSRGKFFQTGMEVKALNQSGGFSLPIYVDMYICIYIYLYIRECGQ